MDGYPPNGAPTSALPLPVLVEQPDGVPVDEHPVALPPRDVLVGEAAEAQLGTRLGTTSTRENTLGPPWHPDRAGRTSTGAYEKDGADRTQRGFESLRRHHRSPAFVLVRALQSPVWTLTSGSWSPFGHKVRPASATTTSNAVVGWVMQALVPSAVEVVVPEVLILDAQDVR